MPTVFIPSALKPFAAGRDSIEVEGSTVDILINNYGTADPGSWLDTDADDWVASYQKNVLSAQRLIRQLLPPMIEAGWGRIINLGTVGSTQPNARSPQYYAAKGALATMTTSLAREVAGTGVRVNLVSPGLILTPEVQAAYLERGRRKGWGDNWEDTRRKAQAYEDRDPTVLARVMGA